MKKILALLLAFVFVFSFAACGKGDPATSSDEATTSETTSVLDVTSESTSTEPTTTSENATSIKPSSSKVSTSKPPQPSINVTSTPPVPTYSGAYLEDYVPSASTTYTYDKLKTDLVSYVSSASPTKTEYGQKVYDLSSNFKKYSVLGYYAQKAESLKAEVRTSESGAVENFECSIKIACKNWETVEAALKRDYDKLNTFAGIKPVIKINTNGNPPIYNSFAEMDNARAQKIYKASGSEHFIVECAEVNEAKALCIIDTSRENNILKVTITFKANYK